MDTTVRSRVFAAEFNALKESTARIVMRQMDAGTRRAEQRIRERVAGASSALLDFLYDDAVGDRRWNPKLASVYTYSNPDRGGARLRFVPVPLKPDDLQDAQRRLRAALAGLVLKFDLETQGASWDMPEAISLRFSVAHGSWWGLGPDPTSKVGAIHPECARLVYPALMVLVDSLPWLRFCPVCHRLFFKVKRKAFCSDEHSRIYFSRKIRGAGDADQPGTRGPDRTVGPGPVDAMHSAWVAMADSGRSPATTNARQKTTHRRG